MSQISHLKMKSSRVKAELFRFQTILQLIEGLFVPWILKFYPYYFNKK